MVYFSIEAFDVLEFCSIEKKQERISVFRRLPLGDFFGGDLASHQRRQTWTDVVRDKTVGVSRKCSLGSVEQDM